MGLNDSRIRYIVETVTASISEAAAIRSALPGEFNQVVKSARQWSDIFSRSSDIEVIMTRIKNIEDEEEISNQEDG